MDEELIQNSIKKEKGEMERRIEDENRMLKKRVVSYIMFVINIFLGANFGGVSIFLSIIYSFCIIVISEVKLPLILKISIITSLILFYIKIVILLLSKFSSVCHP